MIYNIYNYFLTITKRDNSVHYYMLENHKSQRCKSSNFLDLIPLFTCFALKNVHVLRGQRFYNISNVEAKFVYENNYVLLRHRIK